MSVQVLFNGMVWKQVYGTEFDDSKIASLVKGAFKLGCLLMNVDIDASLDVIVQVILRYIRAFFPYRVGRM